jgi:transcriptional regulator with XRE-family HTH domain
VVEHTSPTLRRRELGNRLRELRQQANLTVEEAMVVLECSAAKISRLETGSRGVNARDVRDLCEAYGVDQAEREHLMALVKESRQQTWWQDLDVPYKPFIGLETAASSIRDYESGLVPGLLQTQEYARALIQGMVPRVTEDMLAQSLEARLTRQQILTREGPTTFHAVLDEAALRRVVGGPAVMRGQLAELVNRAKLPNVTIQVIPFEAGAHPGQDSTFMILEFEGQAATDVVYIEGLIGNFYLERQADLERYAQVFGDLCRKALDPERSVDLIEFIGTTHLR